MAVKICRTADTLLDVGQLSAGTSDFVTIWDLLLIVIISASASADPYIFRVISYQCPAQCLL